MPYPPDYHRLYNFNNDAARGLPSPAPARVDSELNLVHEALTDVRRFVVGITTADGKIRPTQPINAAVVMLRDPEETTVAGAPQTVFPFGAAIDAANTAIVVYVNGVRLNTTQIVAYDDDEVELVNAVDVGGVVVVEFYDNEGGILADLAAPEGAGLVGYEDQFGLGVQCPIPGMPNNVEAGLDLALQNLAHIQDELFPPTQFLFANGSVEFTGNQNAAGFSVTGLRVAIAAGEAVVYEQLQAVQDEVDALPNIFLPLDGSSAMVGDLDLGGQSIINLEDGVDPTDAATVGQLEGFLPLAGGTMTGPIDGLAEPTEDDWAANKGYVDTADAALQVQIDNLTSAVGVAENEIFDHFIGASQFVVTPGSSRVSMAYPNITDNWGTVRVLLGNAMFFPDEVGSIATRLLNFTAFEWSLEARIRCVSWTDSDGRATLGVVNPDSESDGVPRGIFFFAQSNQNSGNWQVAWRQTSVVVVHNTSSPATDWLRLKMKRTAAGEFEFFVNDVLAYTITAVDAATIIGTLTNPTTAFYVGMTGGVDGATASNQAIEIDWMRFKEEV